MAILVISDPQVRGIKFSLDTSQPVDSDREKKSEREKERKLKIEIGIMYVISMFIV